MSSGFHSAFIDNENFLWVFGENNRGQLGLGDKVNRLTPVRSLGNVKQVSIGYQHTFILLGNGDLLSCGGFNNACLGNNSKVDVVTPQKIMSGVKSVAASFWGYNIYGTVGVGHKNEVSLPQKIMTGVKKISSGAFSSICLKMDGEVWVWGHNMYYDLGLGDNAIKTLPQKAPISDVIDLGSGELYSIYLKSDQTLWGVGRSGEGQLLSQSETIQSYRLLETDVKKIRAGSYHVMAVKKDDSLWIWGSNNKGQVGIASNTMYLAPQEVVRDVAQISSAYSSSMVIKKDGSVFVWGANAGGELGLGDNNVRNTPTKLNLNGINALMDNLYWKEIIKKYLIKIIDVVKSFKDGVWHTIQ